MPKSYVDEITVRYLMREGYLISQGIWFLLDKEKTGKKVSGWSDIDIFAVKPSEPPLIIQCKSFLGTESSEKLAPKLVKWFENVENFLKNSDYYKNWASDGKYKRVLVVDDTIKKTEDVLKKNSIEVWYYKNLHDKLLEKLKCETEKRIEQGHKTIGKEEDVLLRILSDMVRRGLITTKPTHKNLKS